MSRKGAKSRTGAPGLRSTGTKARTDVDRLRASNADLEKKLAEALEQQAATSEVLRVISGSPGEVQPVLDTIAKTASALCAANDTSIFLREGKHLRIAAHHGSIPIPLGSLRLLNRDLVAGRTVLDEEVIQVADLAAAGDEFPYGREIAQELGHRTTLGIPLMSGTTAIGCLLLRRTVVQPFAEKQVALLRTFADQAVIAIENVRLFDEVQARTRDLTESLEQQTATSEVLQVISTSSGELEPVFETILANAVRICEATFGNMYLRDGEVFRIAAAHNTPPALLEHRRRVPLQRPTSAFGRMVRTKEVVHVADLLADPRYAEREPEIVTGVELGGIRTLLIVPMLKEKDLIGALTIYRQEVRPFNDKQIDLVKNFANQAVIAIENTRLLNELRQRTDDLSEALEQQTASAEVLSVISSSPGELAPVFQAMLENAIKICEANFGNLFTYGDNSFRVVALHNAPPAYREFWEREPIVLLGDEPLVPLARLATSKSVVHVADLATEQGYIERHPRVVALVEGARARTMLLVPMLKEGELIGSIVIYRQEVRPFSGKQIELVKNFAAQAVIAIENARLLNELRQRTDDLSEALEQQTATSEVLQVISRSPGELEPVFQAMLSNAVRVCEAKFGVLFRYSDNAFHAAATLDVPPAYAEFLGRRSFRPDVEPALAGSPLHRLLLSKDIVQSDDVSLEANPGPAGQYGGARSFIAVPLKKESELIGAIVIYRQEVRPFTEKQIDLVQNFAAQAVIAIENARLLSELREFAATADGNVGGVAGHQLIARRAEAGV